MSSQLVTVRPKGEHGRMLVNCRTGDITDKVEAPLPLEAAEIGQMEPWGKDVRFPAGWIGPDCNCSGVTKSFPRDCMTAVSNSRELCGIPLANPTTEQPVEL